jgi:hypothetical protein
MCPLGSFCTSTRNKTFESFANQKRCVSEYAYVVSPWDAPAWYENRSEK